MPKLFIIAYLLLFPAVGVFADLEITEIMYDPEGSDIDREWVEIYNPSSSAIPINEWYFFENDTYHGLTADGFTNLGSGEYALLAKNVATLKSELGSDLRYIKSSFSLNNTGEKLSIADSDKNIKQSISYSSDFGGSGNGLSIQKIGGTWSAGTPTPGKLNSPDNIFIQNENDESSTSETNTNINSSANTIKTVAADYYEAELSVPEVIVAQSDFTLRAEVQHIEGSRSTTKLRGYYYINFGNGDSFSSDEKIEKQYRYRRAGNYILFFEYYSSYLAFEAGEEPQAKLVKNIKVIDSGLEILGVNSFDGLILKNNSSRVIDLGGWKILWGNNIYEFPRYSFIQSGKEINILFSTLGFSPSPSIDNPIQILSNSYKPIVLFPKFKKINKPVIQSSAQTIEKTLTSDREQITIEDPDSFFSDDNGSYLKDYLERNSDKVEVNFGNLDAVENLAKKEKSNNLFYYLLGVVVLMIAAGRYVYREKSEQTENFGSIEIIE